MKRDALYGSSCLRGVVAVSRLLLGCMLLAALPGPLGCGEAQTPTGRYNRVLGGGKEGAPIVLGGTADRGILEDLTTYQPAKPPVSLGGGAGAARPGATEPASDGQADTVAAALMTALSAGQVDAALKLFNPDHVAALTDQQRAELYPTFEKLELFRKTVESKVPAEVVAAMQLPAPIVQVVNPDQASVMPNPAMLLLGPSAATPALTLSRQGEQWLFQLSQPLTTEAAAQVLEFHRRLQAELDKLIDWADQAGTIDPAQLATMLATIMMGQQVEVPNSTDGPEPPSDEPPSDEPPNEPPPDQEP